MEILEAGTGHGSLTIALAKTIHAANPPSLLQPEVTLPTPAPDTRNAIIHTLDISSAHSKHAQSVIANFRRGMYLPHINFHTGTPTSFLKWQFALRSSTCNPAPFLNIILLDLPGPERYFRIASHALHPDGLLGIFCPSITQIADAVKVIKDQKLLLLMEKCIELPNNGGVRSWDVRVAKVRDLQKHEGEEGIQNGDDSDSTGGDVNAGEDMKMICRPQVGTMVVGGGFFAMFRKLDVVQVKKSEDPDGTQYEGGQKGLVDQNVSIVERVSHWLRSWTRSG